MDHIFETKLYPDDIERDLEQIATGNFKLNLVMLEKNKRKIIGRANDDAGVTQCVNKGKLRVELFDEEWEATLKDTNEPGYLAYCFHATKDGESFSNPFIVLLKRNQNNKQIRDMVFEKISNWEIESEKKIKITEDYFQKLKILLKGDVSDAKTSKIENDEADPFADLDPACKKYTLELIHPFTSPSLNNVMKIQK